MPDIATEYSDVISEVRFITDYEDFVFTDSELADAIEFSMREIRAIVEAPGLQFKDKEDNFNARRALMWATCYHLKVKSGEIGSMPMSIGDVDMSHAGSGEHYSELINWVEEFRFYLDRLDDAPDRSAHTSVTREGREYENDRIGDAYGSSDT